MYSETSKIIFISSFLFIMIILKYYVMEHKSLRSHTKRIECMLEFDKNYRKFVEIRIEKNIYML